MKPNEIHTLQPKIQQLLDQQNYQGKKMLSRYLAKKNKLIFSCFNPNLIVAWVVNK